jgi:hypothetical protein
MIIYSYILRLTLFCGTERNGTEQKRNATERDFTRWQHSNNIILTLALWQYNSCVWCLAMGQYTSNTTLPWALPDHRPQGVIWRNMVCCLASQVLPWTIIAASHNYILFMLLVPYRFNITLTSNTSLPWALPDHSPQGIIRRNKVRSLPERYCIEPLFLLYP